MNKNLIRAAALVATMSSFLPANAGFIDERPPTKSEAAVASAGSMWTVYGDFHLPPWQTAISESGVNVSVVDAIARLLPPGQPAVEIEGPASLSDLKVSWEKGTARVSVVQSMAKQHGLIFKLKGRSLSIQLDRAGAPRTPAASQVQQTFGAAAAETPRVESKALQQYDVRLTDIKLSTAITRWAQAAGVRVRWDADKHVIVGAPQTYLKADIFDAVMAALDSPGIRNSDYPLEVCEYPNVPRLLRITRKGEQAKDCPEVVSQHRGN